MKRVKKRIHALERRQSAKGYLFMLPWLTGFLVFTIFPFFYTIFLSFHDVKSTINGWEMKFNGLANYDTAFFKNTEFVPAIVDFLKMIVPYTFVVVILSFIISYMLNRLTKYKGVFRTIYFLPVIIMSGPVMAQILDADELTLLANEMSAYSDIFVMQIIWSYSRQFASLLMDIFDQLSMILWFTGIPIILFINGLQKINFSMYEAAKIDSANSWQILWKITIPNIKSTAMVSTIFTIIQLATYDSDGIYGLIKEAAGNLSNGLGYAATYAWVYSLLVLIIIGLAFLILKEKKADKEGGY